MTNETAYFKYNEIVLLDTEPDKVFVILRSKYYANLNGGSGWSYLLKDEKDQVYKEAGEQWFPQARLKKLHVPSQYSFEGLIVVLRDVVEKGDFS